MKFDGAWICICGETECPYMEIGYSPAKKVRFVPLPGPDLSSCGSSSTSSSKKSDASRSVAKATTVPAVPPKKAAPPAESKTRR